MPKKDNMNLDKVLAISGRPGLFEMVTQSRGGIIAHSLLDGKRISTAVNNQISILSEIQVYCIGGEMPLSEVFEKMLVYENGKEARVSPKAPKLDLEAYFFEVLDQYDEDRVYASDIKKIIQWYNLLLAKGMIKEIPKTEKKNEEKSSTSKSQKKGQ